MIRSERIARYLEQVAGQPIGAAKDLGNPANCENLDQLKPSAEQVSNAVKSGVGIMPAFGDSLSERQISAVAKYIESVTRK